MMYNFFFKKLGLEKSGKFFLADCLAEFLGKIGVLESRRYTATLAVGGSIIIITVTLILIIILIFLPADPKLIIYILT